MWTLESERKKDYWTYSTATVNDFNERLCLEMLERISKYDDFNWSILNIETWIETGDLIIYPGNGDLEQRNEPVAFKICIKQLAESYESIAGLVERSEQLFEEEYDKILHNTADKVRETMKSSLNKLKDKSFIILDPDLDEIEAG